MPSLVPFLHFIPPTIIFFLAFISFFSMVFILYHIIKGNTMLSVGACTRMLARILGYTFPTPAPSASLPLFDPSAATIYTLRRLLDRGIVSSGFLVEIYLEKISRRPSSIFTFPETELMAQARIYDNMRAEGRIVPPLGDIPVLFAVKAATYELMVPTLERAGEGAKMPFVAGSMLVMGFVKENVLGELVKWERFQEGTPMIETCVVEGLAVVVRNVEEGDVWSSVHQ